MKYIYYILFVLLFACKPAEKSIYLDGTLKFNCYVQKEIPGIQEEPSRMYLNCNVVGDAIQWDSVQFNTVNYFINEQSQQIKVEIENGNINSVEAPTFVYYKTKQDNFKVSLNRVLHKEDLYLP